MDGTYTATKLNQVLYPDSKNTISFSDGLEYQDFVVEHLSKQGIYIQLHTSKKYQFERGESVQRAEIKLDRRCTETGRLSIEIAEKTKSDNSTWVSSGIYRNDNSIFYIQGNFQRIYLFNKKDLKRYHERYCEYSYEESPQAKPTVRKFYLPLEKADYYCILRVDIT